MIVDLIGCLIILGVGIGLAFCFGGASWGFVVIFALLFTTVFVLYAIFHKDEEVRERLRWAGLALVITAIIPLLAVIACH